MQSDELERGATDDFSVGPETDDAQRPDIDHLPDVLDASGNFIPKIGDRIIAEQWTSMGAIWLGTRTGRLEDVDQATGNFWCWDDSLGQAWGGNFKTFLKSNHTRYKLMIGPRLKRKRKNVIRQKFVRKIK